MFLHSEKMFQTFFEHTKSLSFWNKLLPIKMFQVICKQNCHTSFIKYLSPISNLWKHFANFWKFPSPEFKNGLKYVKWQLLTWGFQLCCYFWHRKLRKLPEMKGNYGKLGGKNEKWKLKIWLFLGFCHKFFVKTLPAHWKS